VRRISTQPTRPHRTPATPTFPPIFPHTHIESWEKGYKAGRAEAKMNRNLLWHIFVLSKANTFILFAVGHNIFSPAHFYSARRKSGKMEGSCIWVAQNILRSTPPTWVENDGKSGGGVCSGGGKAHPMTQTWTASVVIWQRFSPLQRSWFQIGHGKWPKNQSAIRNFHIYRLFVWGIVKTLRRFPKLSIHGIERKWCQAANKQLWKVCWNWFLWNWC